MKRVFKVVLEEAEEGGFVVYIPELELTTEGDNLEDALEMAEDCINNTLCAYEDEHMDFNIKEFNFFDLKQNQRVAIVNADTTKYRKEVLNRSRKVTLTIPEYLYNAADNYNLNKSKLLQEAILAELKRHQANA